MVVKNKVNNGRNLTMQRILRSLFTRSIDVELWKIFLQCTLAPTLPNQRSGLFLVKEQKINK
jgi:hypothetical protein